MEYPIEIAGKTIKQVTKLNLSNLGLTEIPENVYQYTNLTKLILSGNKIKVIPQKILRLKKLKVMDLSYNQIKTLQSALFKLPHLKTLNVYGNEITCLPKQFYESRITCMIAGRNKLTHVEFEKLQGIEVLDLTHNEINSLHIGKEAEKLKVLRVKGNPLHRCSIDTDIRKHLRYIDINLNTSDNKLKTMAKAENKTKHKIFISYSHDDNKWFQRLKIHLAGLMRFYDIEEWDDQKLISSDEWEKEISKALQQATIAICLVSASFMASDYINRKELPALFEKAHSEGMKIFPLIVSPCGTFTDSWLHKYQSPNPPEKTLIECDEGEAERYLATLVVAIKKKIAQNQ